MKFRVYFISHDKDHSPMIMKEASKVAAYNELDEKSAMCLELLAEELIKLIPYFTEQYKGEFWIESEDLRYELHVSLEVETLSDELLNERKSIIDSKKKNKFSGIAERIREAIDKIAIENANSPENRYYNDGMPAEYAPISQVNQKQSYANTWRHLRHNFDDDAMDSLGKSIFASFADDIIIGVAGNKIDITIPKTFG